MEGEVSDWSKERLEEQAQDLMFRSQLWAMMVQGLLDRSEVFHPHSMDMSIFKNENGMVKFIYDAENILTTGRLPWPEWLREINSNLGRGSSVIYSGHGGGFFKEYAEYAQTPDKPGEGLYTLDERYRYRTKYTKKENGWGYDTYQEKGDKAHLGFAYKPGGTYWTWKDDAVERKNSVFWIPEWSHILNYDKICVDDIDYYLQSRPDRIHYLAILPPLLLKLREMYTAEMEKGKLFIQMVVSQVVPQYPKVAVKDIEQIVIDCVDWWKYKVIWKRPVTQDDTKAYKMIMSEVRQRLDNLQLI
jgi:hypothetical protein